MNGSYSNQVNYALKLRDQETTTHIKNTFHDSSSFGVLTYLSLHLWFKSNPIEELTVLLLE